ncbi:hypothetical protein BALAC2494_01986 [Bifidobacterium animalis subsp. lactis CNCM I-2494]|uniref:Uncharacterized protein n=1 Tax=Bifidobacterium animalis subsp. lactis CNCM I-2494 TaxID=1042403 RepID=A0A806FFZ3_BIFAN|nr:hypothetical protein BALAC2494_01986 [Bifidobacterium animalis subsp. lactis CNCM I-2494]
MIPLRVRRLDSGGARVYVHPYAPATPASRLGRILI